MAAPAVRETVAYVIADRDTVATALEPASPGRVRLRGAREGAVEATEEIPRGHKVALVAHAAGDPVVKYGVVIATATKPIAPGQWVHLHCAESRFDARSAALDPVTGAPTDTSYT